MHLPLLRKHKPAVKYVSERDLWWNVLEVKLRPKLFELILLHPSNLNKVRQIRFEQFEPMLCMLCAYAFKYIYIYILHQYIYVMYKYT